MELLVLLIVVSAVGWVAYTGRRHTLAFNDNTEARFGYRPISLGTLAIGAIPCVLLLLGTGFDDGPGASSSLPMNTVVAILAMAALIYGLYRYLERRTDSRAASIATAMLVVGGVGLLIVAVVMLVAMMGESDDRDRF